MSSSVKQNIVLQSIELIAAGNGKFQLVPTDESIYANPFHDLLDMAQYCEAIYSSQDLDLLREFVTASDDVDVKNGRIRNHTCLDMYCFVVEMIFRPSKVIDNDEWMDFDEKILSALLDKPFFDDYNEWSISDVSKRKYPFLDVYCYAKLQSYATTVLPEEYLWDVNHIWTFEDFLLTLYELEWFKLISDVYESYGINWFASNAENDPVKYKWACYAVSACKKVDKVSNQQLKRDLFNLHNEMLIAFSVRGTIDKNKEIVEHVRNCVLHFDDERIDKLVENINKLKTENIGLISQNSQLNEGLTELRYQIAEMQSDRNLSDEEIINELVNRAMCLSPQDHTYTSDVENLKSIWEKLDRSTREGIKLSFSMFKQFEQFDIAIFPMIRGLEHEFDRNFFTPFHQNMCYKNIRTFNCRNAKYKQTHDSLVKRGKQHPTLGTIPYIGRAMSDVEAQNASEVIRTFRLFIAGKRKEFQRICEDLNNYKATAKAYNLIQIRNGIAHGDDSVIKHVDKNSYEEISRLLYEPPLQILFRIINISKKR